MKQILVLGAGFVARPLVAYLLEQESVEITVASRTLFKAENLVGGHPRGKAVQLDVEAASALDTLVSQSNVVISLLPWVHHLEVAKLCLAHGKHLVTTSYVKPEMEALDAEARAKGLLFLNEIGLDPGIDHMAAMRVMDEIRNTGGTVESFYSYCGGLPAPEHNTNPLGYKFSWSPTGVLLAAGNEGRYLEEGGIIEIPGSELFTHYWFVRVPGAGVYEAYVNRDALPYLEIYGIPEARSMYRGTLRNIGHCETWHLFKRMGLLDRDRTFDFSRFTPREVMARLIDAPGNDLPKELADYLQISEYSVLIKKLEWLGLLNDYLLDLKEATVFEMFDHVLETKLKYAKGELDYVLQHHEFTARYGDDRMEKITSTLIERGTPDGDSAMARTVGLPAAVATRLLVEEKLTLTGVCRPVYPEIYNPVLNELERMSIRLDERTLPLSTQTD